MQQTAATDVVSYLHTAYNNSDDGKITVTVAMSANRLASIIAGCTHQPPLVGACWRLFARVWRFASCKSADETGRGLGLGLKNEREGWPEQCLTSPLALIPAIVCCCRQPIVVRIDQL
jgi:hypothetical protein